MKLKNLRNTFTTVLLSAAFVISSGSLATPLNVEAANQSDVYYGLADNIQDGVILHCFDWTYQQIIDELPDIAAAGFTSVQTSPAQAAVTGYSTWYYLYQPNGFYINNSGLGSEEDLKRLCDEADKYGIKVIVDVVANHLAGDHSNIDGELKGSQFWHWYGDSISYSNRYAITHGNIGMQDLNSEDSTVQNKVKNYIAQLKNDGVDGIRWDAAKHISLPSESCSFWSNVIDSGMYNYGEILDNPVENNQSYANSLINEYTNYMSVTDNKYSSTILGAINGGTVSSSIGYWTQNASVSDNKLVYWAESHDTYSNNTNEGGWTKYIDQNKIDRAYAAVASRNNATSLYFSRPSQTSKTAIKVGEKGSTHYESKEVAAVNHFHNACIGEADYYTTYDNVSVTTRKSGAVLVLGSGSNRWVSVPNGGQYTTPGTYYDEITGNQFTVTKDTISGTVGNTGIAVFYKADPEPVRPVVKTDRESCTFVDSIDVNYTISNADSYTITVNNVESDKTSFIFTEDTKVVINATNSAGTTTKEYTYIKDTSEKRILYVDTNNCSWFNNNNAVAAVKTDKDSEYTKMTQTTVDGKTVYMLSVPSSATTATFARMLPSGKCYNEKTVTLNSNYNYYTSDNNWSTLTASKYESSEIINPITTISIYFTDNSNWNNVYAYTWGGSSTNEQWPGTKMTYVSTNEYSQKVYKIDIPSDVTGIIFNNGSKIQTVDITTGIADGTGYYILTSGSKCTVGTYTYEK